MRAARAAVTAGPLAPLLCEATVESDDDTKAVDSLEELEQLLLDGDEAMAMELWVAHVVADDASVTLAYNGRWLQLNGAGDDWERAPRAYDAAKVELAHVAGITTLELPDPPPNAVAERRRRQDESRD